MIPFYFLAVVLVNLFISNYAQILGENLPSAILNLVTLYTSGLFTFVYMFLLAKMYLLSVILLVLFSYVQLGRLKASNKLLALAPLADWRIQNQNLTKFTQLHTRILLDICEANRLFGYTLLVNMLVSSPISAYLFILLICFNQSPLMAAHHASLLSYSWLLTLGIHLLAAQYTNRIHQCAKPLLHLSAHFCQIVINRKKCQKCRRHLLLRARLKLAFYVEKFHCCKNRRWIHLRHLWSYIF